MIGIEWIIEELQIYGASTMYKGLMEPEVHSRKLTQYLLFLRCGH